MDQQFSVSFLENAKILALIRIIAENIINICVFAWLFAYPSNILAPTLSNGKNV